MEKTAKKVVNQYNLSKPVFVHFVSLVKNKQIREITREEYEDYKEEILRAIKVTRAFYEELNERDYYRKLLQPSWKLLDEAGDDDDLLFWLVKHLDKFFLELKFVN